MTQRTEKTPAKSPATSATVPMQPQQHGGALRRGGTNRGGPGRPRNAVRQLARRGAAQAIPRLIEIVTGKFSDPKDVITAARVLLEFGLGRQLEVDGQVDHEHRFVVEVPAMAASSKQWADRYRRLLTGGGQADAAPAPLTDDPAT